MKISALQAMGDSEKQSYMRGQKTLEINPYHPLIQELKMKVHGNDMYVHALWHMSAGAPRTRRTCTRPDGPRMAVHKHSGNLLFCVCAVDLLSTR